MMQRQVYTQPARNTEEANRRNKEHVVKSGFIWVGEEKIGLIENGDVFSIATEQKFATLNEKGLYSLDGQPLYLHLETVNGGGRIGAESHPSAIARFMTLADGSES